MTPFAFPRLLPCAIAATGAFLFTALIQGAESAKVELHTLPTVSLSDQQFLTGAKAGKPVVIAAELRLPRLGTDRLPEIIIVHGSGGIMGNEDRSSRELNDLGIATFTLDGFTARGIANTGADQSQLGSLTMILLPARGTTRLA